MSDEELENYRALAEETKDKILTNTEDLSLSILDQINQLWWHWADLEIKIESPAIEIFSPPHFIPPEKLADSEEFEPVYTIVDHGNQLNTSKASEMYSVGMSMFKLHSTIEKMIYILVERLKTTGIDTEIEVQVSFAGNELAKRKAFESIINLSYNVVVTNFNPDTWGEKYLQTVKVLADKGFGYPPESPRDKYRYSGKTKGPSR